MLICHFLPTYSLAGNHHAIPGSRFHLFLVTTGTRTATQNNHDVYIIVGKGYQLELVPLLRYLRQSTGYSAQIHLRITAAAVSKADLHERWSPAATRLGDGKLC